MPHQSHHQRVVIIGGGFAGAVTASKIIDASSGPLHVSVIEPLPEIGRGIAYSAPDRDHLVNGYAQGFGLFPDDPDHLVRWLARQVTEGGVTEGGWLPPPHELAEPTFHKSFPPRWVYGSYVADTLRETLARARGRVTLDHVRERAVDLDIDGRRASVQLQSGRRIPADAVVLATGLNPRRSTVSAPPGINAAAYYVDGIWRDGIDPRIPGTNHVLLVGSGLTMLDSLISLEKSGFRGRYTIVSRSGQVVLKRRDVEPFEDDILAGDPLPATTLGALRILQRARRAAIRQGEDPQRLALSLRTHLVEFWRNASIRERSRFIRHLSSYWAIAMHRAAPASYAFFQRAREAGRIEHFAARVLNLDIRPGEGVAVSLRRRGNREPELLHVDAVVNSSGNEFDWTRLDDPLVRNLLRKGIVRPHGTRSGIDADPDTFAVIGSDGVPSSIISAVGHPLRGVLWEASSIREQLDHAIRVSRVLFPPARQTGEALQRPPQAAEPTPA